MAHKRPGLWWISPPGTVLLIVPVTLGLSVAYSPEDFVTYFRLPKTLDTATALLFAAGAGLLILGALLVQAGHRSRTCGTWPWFDEGQVSVLDRASTVLFRATLAGYASFVVVAARNGVSASDVLGALLRQDVSSGALEKRIGTVPGVTTLTQVGVAFAVVTSILLLHRRHRRDVLRITVVLLLTLIRAFVLTERLALIEVVVPALAVLAMRASQRPEPGRRLLLRLAPIPLVMLLILGFAASEYSRSYQFYKSRTSDGLLLFATKRLTGYYATSYNNGQITLDHETYPGRLPYGSLAALWTAPVIGKLNVYDRLAGRDSKQQYERLLQTYGSPEFNNPGGLSTPFVDFGRTGGLVVLFGIGLAVGFSYRSFSAGRPAGVLLYPVVVTGLLELPRFLYWTLGRTVPAFLALLLVIVAVQRSGRYRPTLTP